jgi:hypothetical protein
VLVWLEEELDDPEGQESQYTLQQPPVPGSLTVFRSLGESGLVMLRPWVLAGGLTVEFEPPWEPAFYVFRYQYA